MTSSEETPTVSKKPKKVTPNQSFDADDVVPFSVKIRGVSRHYCITEMSGGARDTYLAEVKKVSKVGKDDKGNTTVEMTDFNGMSTMMLKHCIYGYDTVAKCSDGQLVDEAVISSWPTSVLDMLVATANDLSSLGEDSDEKAGNA